MFLLVNLRMCHPVPFHPPPTTGSSHHTREESSFTLLLKEYSQLLIAPSVEIWQNLGSSPSHEGGVKLDSTSLSTVWLWNMNFHTFCALLIAPFVEIWQNLRSTSGIASKLFTPLCSASNVSGVSLPHVSQFGSNSTCALISLEVKRLHCIIRPTFARLILKTRFQHDPLIKRVLNTPNLF